MNKMILVMVLAGLLIFGCTSQQPGPSPGAVNATGPAGGAGNSTVVVAAVNASAGSNTTQGTPAGGSGGASAPVGNGTSGGVAGGGTDVASIATYAAAMATGLPLECTAAVGGQPLTIDIKGQNMYMKMMSGGQTYEMVYKNSVTYMKLSTEMQSTFAQMGKVCNWLMITANSSSTSGGVSAPVSANSVEGSDVTWSCKPGQFGDDVFLTPGNSCSMSDLYPGTANSAAPPGY